MTSLIVKIDRIHKNPDNPRTISDAKFERLVQSIKAFPEMLRLRPIVVNPDFIVLGGNMRLKACRAAGLTEVPVLIAEDLTPEQEREFIIKDNVGFGEWDLELLRLEWDTGELSDWGLDIPQPEILELPEAVDDNFEMPDDVKTDIVPGDVFQIGPHRLICGDARHTDTWDKLLDGRQLDLVTTDPPYNVDYAGKNIMLNKALKGSGNRLESDIENDNLSPEAFYDFLYDAFTAMAAYTRPGGAWYVWHADTEGINFRSAFGDAGLLLKQCLVWVKNILVIGRQDYHWKHEPCLYGWKPGAAHYFTPDRTQTTVIEDLADISKLTKKQLQALIRDLSADNVATSVLRADKPASSREHPTMKPVKLIAQNIENSSRIGEAVGDGFGGSGTTMVAAHQLKRVCFMAENTPKYCQVIIDRMKRLDPELTIKRINHGIL